MDDATISDLPDSGNDEDRRAAEKTSRAKFLTDLGYQFNPETGTWRLKPKEKKPKKDAGLSQQFLNFPDEDYADCVCLLLPNNEATLVDADLFEHLTNYQWHVLGRTVFYNFRAPVTYERRRCGTGRTGYGNFRQPGWSQLVTLHTMIIEMVKPRPKDKKNHVVDHADRNPWNNLSRNLRYATHSENMQNKAKGRRGKSKYKGVSKDGEGWRASITLNGASYDLGRFSNEDDAARAYNRFVRKHCPEFGFINTIPRRRKAALIR